MLGCPNHRHPDRYRRSLKSGQRALNPVGCREVVVVLLSAQRREWISEVGHEAICFLSIVDSLASGFVDTQDFGQF